MHNESLAFLAQLPDGWHRGIPEGAAAVMLELAANTPDGVSVALTFRALADGLGVTTRTVERHMDALEAARLIVRTGGAFGKPNQYTIPANPGRPKRGAAKHAAQPRAPRSAESSESSGGDEGDSGTGDESQTPPAPQGAGPQGPRIHVM